MDSAGAGVWRHEADEQGAVDTVSDTASGINSGRRALVVPSHSLAPATLPLQSPSSPVPRHPFPLSPVQTNLSKDAHSDHNLRIDSGTVRSGNLTIKGSHRRHAHTSDEASNAAPVVDSNAMATYAKPRPHQLEAVLEEARPLAASSQTVRAPVDYSKMPTSPSGSTSSLLSLYEHTDSADEPAPSATAEHTATADIVKVGNVRGAGDQAVDAQRPTFKPACAGKNNGQNNSSADVNKGQNNCSADVNNNNAGSKSGDSSNGPCERFTDSNSGSKHSGDSKHSTSSCEPRANSAGNSLDGSKQQPSALKALAERPNAPDYHSSNIRDNSKSRAHPPRKQRLNSDNGRTGMVPSMTDADYADRFGNYYDYLPIDDEPVSKQRAGGGGGDSTNGRLEAMTRLPPLRSTFKSEPMIRARAKGSDTFLSKDSDPRNSYSQMLENALFYSQAIEQIRELDTIGASNPYSAAMPRARPGKEDIRQRRARNAIASREVFNITTPSTFIPLPRNKHAMMPPPMSMDRLWAMRSEPEIKRYVPEDRPSSRSATVQAERHAKPSRAKTSHGSASGSNSGSNSSSSAVPISRFLPRSIGPATGSAALSQGVVPPTNSVALSRSPTPQFSTGDSSSISVSLSRRGSDFAHDSERRAGFDQPVPTPSDLDEGLKQRRAGSPMTLSSSLRAPRNSARPHSTADSDVLPSDDEGNTREKHGRQVSHVQQSNRHSIASHFSSIAGSMRMPVSANGKPHGHRGHHPHLHQLSSHSRKVATRLLMRAGLSRIAIRVARTGPSAKDTASGSGGVFESNEAMASSVFGSEAASGIDVDPNGLQGLKAERRKQVKLVDEFGFMQFEGDSHESEHTQLYDAWQARAGDSKRRPQLDVRAASEGKWQTMLQSFDAATLRGSHKVKKLVQAGVPHEARAQFYYVLSGAAKIEQTGEYARLAGQEALPIYDVIERDVARCYPDHIMFADADGAGQRQLRRILRAYAQYNPDIGYCQGMGRLVGLFLISGLGEEHAFWVLAATIRNFIPRYYESDLAGLREHTAVFEVLLHERNPRLASHLAEQGCDALMYATPWFMTVFTLSLPWPAALRVWDWFMYRGTKVLFRVALAITDLASSYLLDACPTIAELLGFLLHIPPALVDADSIIAAAIRVKISERHVERLVQRASASR
ncbi:hypothetical protein GGH12_003206 [Coemansia sp. RSA 1822]|nr:hypothetical protein LPJ76_003457 [Coemansia sp. RSA 638]KAJ2542231.1 hypothetical protein GGF49_003032 [Coemansia sp. RSA 1853]KAJ2562428.1 hypothetical protein GGH12_003206 [Coemansia sp. RSA 1822]